MTDPVSAQELVEHQAFLRGMARQLLGDEGAEDVVQDALVMALEKPPLERNSLRAWLAIVVSNGARTWARTASRRRHREKRVARPELQEPNERAIERIEICRVLGALVEGLPPLERRVLHLRYYEGMSMTDISECLDGACIETVRRHHGRAIERLRRQLDARSHGDRTAWVSELIPLVGARRAFSSIGSTASIKLGAVAAVIATACLMWKTLEGVGVLPPSEGASSPAVAPAVGPADAASDEPRGPREKRTDRAVVEEATRILVPFGRVVDEVGQPVPGALVHWAALLREDLEREPAWQEDDWGPFVRVASSTLADASGAFAFEPTSEPRWPSFLWAHGTEGGFAMHALRAGESLPPGGIVLVLFKLDPLLNGIVALGPAGRPSFDSGANRRSTSLETGPVPLPIRDVDPLRQTNLFLGSGERTAQPTRRVTDAGGAPIEGAEVHRVELTREDLDEEPAWREEDWGVLDRRTLTTRTDAGGFFAFDEDSHAEHGVLLWAWKLGFEASGLALPAGESPAKEPRTLVLAPAAPVRVLVTRASGEPAAGALVRHFATTPRWIAEDDSPDRFRRVLADEATADEHGVALLVPFPGEEVLLAQHGDANSLPWRGESADTVRLVLRDGFTVAGSLAGVDAGIDGERRIRFVSLEGAVERTLATLRDVQGGPFGPVTLPHVPRGRYSALLEGAPLVPQFFEFDSPGVGGRVQVDFEARIGVELALVAVEASGDVILDAEAELYWPVGGRKGWLRCRAGEDGVLRARGLPAGSVRYRVGAPGFATFYSDSGVVVPLESPTPIRVPLEPAGTLRGTVLHDGRPVPDFKLWAWLRNAPQETLQRSFTDRADGTFVWSELPIGEAVLTAAGTETSSSDPRFVQVSAEAGEPLVIELPGAAAGTGTLRSGVTGLPLAGATVEVCRLAGPYGPIAWQGRPATTGPDGAFRIEGLGPGGNWLVAQATGHATDSFDVEVREAGPVDVGELFLWSEQAFVVELAGPPSGFDPGAYHANIDTGGPERTFDADGRVRFEGVCPGSIGVSIRRPQGGWFKLMAEVAPGRDTVLRHDLGKGGRLHIEVAPEEGYDASAGFSAYVDYADRRGVVVQTGLALNATGVTTLEGMDTDGDVFVKLLRKGDWAIVGVARGSFDGAQDLHLRVPAGGAVLAVRAVGPDRAPLEGVSVMFAQPGPPLFALDAFTDAEGWARLHVPSESGWLHLQHERFGTLESLPWPGGPGELEVELRADSGVSVVVRDDAGPVVSATVRTNWIDDFGFANVQRTDAAGRARIDGLTAGPVRIRVEHARHWPVDLTLEARPDAPLTEVRLAALGRLELQLVDADGAPLRGVELALRSLGLDESVASWLAAGRVLGSLVTDGNGELALERLPAGEYAWIAPGTAGGTLSVRGEETSRSVLRRE